MTPEERLQKIESYGGAHALLVESLKGFPRSLSEDSFLETKTATQ